MTLDTARAAADLWCKLAEHFLEDESSELDYSDFVDFAEEIGLLMQVPYNPEVHGEMDVEPGDRIYVMTDLGRLLASHGATA